MTFFEKKRNGKLAFSEITSKLNIRKQRFIPLNKEYIGAARPYCTYYQVGAVYETLLLFFCLFFSGFLRMFLHPLFSFCDLIF